MISIGVKCSEVDVEKRGRWEAGAFYQVVGELELGPISRAGLNQSIGAYRDRRKSKDERVVSLHSCAAASHTTASSSMSAAVATPSP